MSRKRADSKPGRKSGGPEGGSDPAQAGDRRRKPISNFEVAEQTGSGEALNRLFVYGSLRSGQTARSLIANSVTRCVVATMQGMLYTFPMGYPAFVDGDGVVVGELLWVTDLAATLALIDAFEGADFVRGIRKATIQSSRAADQAGSVDVWAWVYSLADPSAAKYGERIADGDWVKYWKENLD